MKRFAVMLHILAAVAPAAAARGGLNPITRVVELLEGLSKKLEADGKAEDDLFDKYVCWYKTVTKAKEASNAAATDRIQSLEAYIDDIKAGKIEFTTERVDLEKQIADLQSAIDEATDMRDKEHEDYLAAKEEMEKAISALEQAVEVLADVNKEGKGEEGSMLGLKFDLRHVLALGRSILDKGDLQFMEHMLDDEVPNPDWKKLNRKATFKMKYSPRSKKIHKILADMLQTFKDNLVDAEDKEKASKEAYDKLMASKEKELETAKQALTDMAKEGAARQMSMQEAQQEVDDLKEQVEADKGFIADVQKAYDEKNEEYKKRKEVRAEEIGAISKAIAILRSDDARDTFKKSFDSQGYLLLQLRQRHKHRAAASWKERVHSAAAVVRAAGEKAKDPRLSMLALRVLMRKKGHFDEVLEAIDKMVARLEEEEGDDLKNKEDCEDKRMDKTKEARSVSLDVDDAREEMDRQKQIVEEQKSQIELDKEAIKKSKEDLKSAEEQREDQKRVFEANKADDEKAVELIENAMEVLKEFYADSEVALTQAAVRKIQIRRQPPEVTAGEAPPPPPPTFEGDYEGAKGEATGIQTMLATIKEDVEKDIKAAEDGEKAAIEEFEKVKEDLETAISDAEKRIADAEGVISDAEEELANQKQIQSEKMESLGATMKEISALEPGCDFIAVNFQVRTKNRQLEIDGLKKAKAILEGAAFE